MKIIPAFVVKEFRQLRRDKFMLRFLLAAPIMQLIVLGFALTMEVKNVKIWVCDQDKSVISRQIVQAIDQSDRFILAGMVSDRNDLEQKIKGWHGKMGLYIPQDFSRNIGQNRMGGMQLLLDAVDGNSALTGYGYLFRIINETVLFLAPPFVRENYMTAGPMIDPEFHYLFNPGLRSESFMVPGVVVLIITVVTLLLSALGLVKEKETGTLEQLMVTPVKKYELILGKLLPFFIYAAIELTVVLKLSEFIFHLKPVGSVFTIYLASAVYLFTTLGLGLLVSTVSRTQQQALFLAWFFLIFLVLLSGFFIPIDNMPGWLKVVTRFNPLRYMMTIIREVYLKGTSIKGLLDQFLPLGALGIAIFSASVLRFSKKLD